MDNHYRLIEKNGETQLYKYAPSTSELLLEEICQSFGTELSYARMDSTGSIKLVRNSEPAIFIHPANGKKRDVAFQYIRFPPFHSQKKFTEVYNKNRSLFNSMWKEIPQEKILEEIKQVIKKEYNQDFDVIKTVTDNNYIPCSNLTRWEKELSFAFYDINEMSQQELKELLVYRRNNLTPTLRIRFHIEPYFVIGSMVERKDKIYDTLTIEFPRINRIHESCIEDMLSSHPLNMLNKEKVGDITSVAFIELDRHIKFSYKIHSSTKRELTMGAIHTYFTKILLEKNL